VTDDRRAIDPARVERGQCRGGVAPQIGRLALAIPPGTVDRKSWHAIADPLHDAAPIALPAGLPVEEQDGASA
jgi:hypothetical protein